ncbi:thioredoxin-like protein [Boletus reticuloceps]|uniref:Thioredoxin-like protein n=1 Tax=Boletus reticuloceps TaxID=495285 RepID=A0A8I3A9N1_9AGAM|nr:thioredoxin-like protein [Boletus reticuloceps]
MNMFHSPLSLVVAVLSVLATAAPTHASNVLTPQNFKQSIAQGVWFVEYFSPHCPHCRHFEPTWDEVVDHFESMPDPGVHLAQVNCALNGDLCNDNGISGYPQMNLYRDGEFVETYNTDREFHFLIEFLQERAEPQGTSQKEDVPTSAEQAATPTPTPSPSPSPSPTADRLVVQTPRTNPNPSGTVVSLNVQTFDHFLAQGPAFIKFFAPWCGHCKKLAPAWTQLARRMQYELNVAEVDCEQQKALCASQGVTGFPMMFFYAHGTKTEYTGGRSYDQLISFADKASNPTMQTIDATQLEQVVRNNPVMYLLLHDASNDRIVTDVAKGAQVLLGSPPVYVSTSSELLRKHNLASRPVSAALLAFKDGDAREPVAVFHFGSALTAEEDNLHAWMHAHRFPSALELSKEVFQQVMFAPHAPLVVIVAAPEGQQGAVSDKLVEIAKKWRLRVRGSGGGAGSAGAGVGGREVVFTWMDAGQWGKWLKDMYGVRVQNEPVVVVADHSQLMYYDKDASKHAILLNSISISSALESILAGTAHAKPSRSMLERGVHAMNTGLVWLEGAIPAHPYVTACAVLGFMGVVAMALWTVLKEEPADWMAERRYAKGDRLD